MFADLLFLLLIGLIVGIYFGGMAFFGVSLALYVIGKKRLGKEKCKGRLAMLIVSSIVLVLSVILFIVLMFLVLYDNMHYA